MAVRVPLHFVASQVVALQSLYWLLLGGAVAIWHQLHPLGPSVLALQVRSIFTLPTEAPAPLVVEYLVIHLTVGLAMAYFAFSLLHVQSRVADFVATLYSTHVIVTIAVAGVPRLFLWWIAVAVEALVLLVFSELLVLRRSRERLAMEVARADAQPEM